VKRGDLIICDEDCHYGIQQGIGLSRSNVLYFKHNDMQDLQRVLADVKEKDELRPPTKLNRRFIIVEGLYQKHGDLAPLDKIVELKKDYKYRLILDDSLAIGVLGRTGRGSPEHWGVPFSEVEILTATLDHAVGSAGGFCVGSAQVVDHQRLSGLGYCFSASAPPYVSTAAITALAVMEREPQRLRALAANAKALRDGLRQIPNVTFVGDDCSPVVHLRLKKSAGSREYDEVFWKIVAEKLLRESSIVVIVPKYIPGERKLPEPSLRISVMAAHKRAEIEQLLKKLRAAIEAASKL
jgi:serine palmitoyltransferase